MASRFEIVDEEYLENLKDKCGNGSIAESIESIESIERNFQVNLEE